MELEKEIGGAKRDEADRLFHVLRPVCPPAAALEAIRAALLARGRQLRLAPGLALDKSAQRKGRSIRARQIL